MDPEVLKLGIIFADIVNGIMHEFGSIIVTSASVEISGYLAMVLTGTIFIMIGIVYLIHANRKYLKYPGDSAQLKVGNVVISVFTFAGSILHFTGDNLPGLAEQIGNNANGTIILNGNSIVEINSIRTSLLVLAVLLYHVIPYGFGKLVEKCPINDNQKTEEKMSYKTYSSIFKEVVFASIVTVEFEVWFTVIQRTGTCSQTQLALVWTVWVMMIIVYGLVLIARITVHIHATHNTWRHHVVGIIIGILVLTAFGLYLLGDNMQPLDCYQDLVSDKEISIIKLCFLCVSLILFAIPLGSYPLVKFLDRKLNETVPRDVKQHDSPSNVQETQV